MKYAYRRGCFATDSPSIPSTNGDTVAAQQQPPPLANLSYPTSSVPALSTSANPYSKASTVPPPSTLASDFYQVYGSSIAPPGNSTVPPTATSYPMSTTIDFLQSQQQQPMQQQPWGSQPPIQMYSTYPQVQPIPEPSPSSQPAAAGGTVPVASSLFQSNAVTTPISLPGMPPITVSATIQPEALRGLQFTNAPIAPAGQQQPPLMTMPPTLQ
uniref:Uncharacterized protein n=1 Tax=Anopheles maculatus TaxID=74869 RepID=A0A182ST11_9DIPT